MKRFIFPLIAMVTLQSAFAQSYTVKHYAKHHFGFKQTEETKKKMRAMPHRRVSVTDPIPSMTDLSPSVSLPEDQGTCGSCWSFALTKALRSEYMLNSKHVGVLEFNYLLNNCGSGPKMWGCEGGDFTAAMSFLRDEGPGLNALNPYAEREGKCKHLPVAATAVKYQFIGPTDGRPSFREIAYALGVENHMLVTDVAAGAGNWEDYEGGIYNGCTHGEIDHMINIVGYDCETSVDKNKNCVFDLRGRPINHDGYLILQNNWGEDWGTTALNGHGGYMKSRMYGKRGSLCNEIATDVLYFDVSPSIMPTPSSTPSPIADQKCGRFFCSVACWLPWC